MPAISKIRLTNIVYDEGNKRYNDELFLFDGNNGAILLENGGGKTVLIQAALQAVIPHADLAERKIKNTLLLENSPAHIAIEWIDHDNPRRYVVTAVTLFLTKQGLDSLRYVYEYNENDPNGIEGIPFVRDGVKSKRPAEKGEMQDYYNSMKEKSSYNAHTFDTIKGYKEFIEQQYHIISNEWDSIVKINSTEGGVEAFFDDCKSTNQLFDRLLIPTVEDAIVGHDKMMFADMFEKQHQSFKNYKKLKETIEENKRIQEKLEQYVETYGKLHDIEQAYLGSKQEAKGVWNFTLSEKQNITAKLAEISATQSNWETDEEQHKMKTVSYEIAVEKAKLEQMETAYKKIYAHQLERKEQQKNIDKEYYSLRLAKHKLDLKEEQDKLSFAEERLANLEKDEGFVDLQAELEKAEQALLGNYLNEMEKVKREIQGITYERQAILERIDKFTTVKENTDEKINAVKEERSGIRATIKIKKADMEKIKQQILGNPQQEQVSLELKKWEERSNELDDEIVRLKQEVKRLTNRIQEANEQREKLLKEQSAVKETKHKVTFQLNALQEAQKNLLTRLVHLRPQWANVEDIYTTQQTIESRIDEHILKLKKERTNLLYSERLSYRFVDDYGHQDLFFGDAYLEEQLASWKNQFDYLVTGVEYADNLKEPEKSQMKAYPHWPVTLITTNRSKQQLVDKLHQIADRLQFPITVLTTEEALRVNEVKEQAWVAPQHWISNLDPDYFIQWKKQLKEAAEETTKLRELKENELTEWEDSWKAFKQFLQTYPFEVYSQLNSEQKDLENQSESISIQINRTEGAIKDTASIVEITRKKINNYESQKQGLDGKIDKGYNYISDEKTVEEQQQKNDSFSETLGKLEKDRLNLERNLAYLQDENEELNERLANFKVNLLALKQNEDYQRVSSLRPIDTNESRQSLKHKIQNLNLEIRQITSTQGEWQAKKEAAKKAMGKLDEQIEEIRMIQGDLDEEQIFPSDGNAWMTTLWNKSQEIKNELSTIEEKVQQSDRAKASQEGKYKNQIENFKKDFPGQTLVPFEDSLEVVKDSINDERKKLAERKAFIDQQQRQYNKQFTSIEKAERELEKHIESHHFNAPDLKELSLPDEQQRDFQYNRETYVQSIIDNMKKARAKVDEKSAAVNQAKIRFRDFCKREITDIKLMQMAINGVEHKQTHEDLIKFKSNMDKSIGRITKYANEHIRKSDEELQLFINQIYTHLINIVDELKQIPMNTRVKVLDDWKRIYTFTIPEWEEETGKTRIRNYIEWILQQLESDRYIDERGLVDEGQVRKELEMWLQTKSLLQVVMNNEVMKVRCRKVTNDNRVTGKSFSWEQSNVWSGGEKWSKNMTLFLGILNYVAEKKKFAPANMKRHRAVILDNPFGKASSDHVLSPVFFVAEQLGFQIIALTAHAEGKFLQDYFPILYSCRLRASQESGKTVMTKVRWLHHAYFKDHEPQRMDRLGEVEQIELF